jgi:hypothetical protein
MSGTASVIATWTETERLYVTTSPLYVIYVIVLCFISVSYYFGSIPYLAREYLDQKQH